MRPWPKVIWVLTLNGWTNSMATFVSCNCHLCFGYFHFFALCRLTTKGGKPLLIQGQSRSTLWRECYKHVRCFVSCLVVEGLATAKQRKGYVDYGARASTLPQTSLCEAKLAKQSLRTAAAFVNHRIYPPHEACEPSQVSRTSHEPKPGTAWPLKKAFNLGFVGNLVCEWLMSTARHTSAM